MQLCQQGLEHVPTREIRATVVLRKQRGCTDEQIAESLGMSPNTLAKYYDVELKSAREVFTDKVFGKLAGLIEGDNAAVAFNAQKFYLTHQAGWKSADKMAEVDALKENTEALKKKAATDELVAELRGHLKADAETLAEIPTHE